LYGPAYFRKSIFFPWSDVLSIAMDSSEISWMQSYGGRVRIPLKTTITVPALKVVLKNNLSSKTKEKIKDALAK